MALGVSIDPEGSADESLLKAWIYNWKHTDDSWKEKYVRAQWSSNKYRDVLNNIKESKTLSPSGLHFGHPKAVLEDTRLARICKSMDMLPFRYGFAPEIRKKIINVMI